MKNIPRLACWCLLLSLAPLSAMRAEPLVAYTDNGAIYTARLADGKDARKVCTGDDPCISNDGRFLVYTSSTQRAPGKSRRHGGDTAEAAPTRALTLRQIAGGKETLLPADGSQQVYGALWSPDDTWIALNVLTGSNWQAAVIHPDGSGYHVLSARLGDNKNGYSLAGWNLHTKGVLVQNLQTLAELDPATGEPTWQRPLQELTGEDSASSSLRCTISASGKLLVSTRYVQEDEFSNLDGPSSYLVLTDFPDGKPRRVTPPKFDAASPWVDLGGQFILLRGFAQKDVTSSKHSDSVKLKTRIYRYDISSGKMTRLIEGGETPSASRD